MPVEMGSVYGGLETAIVVELPLQFEPGDYIVSASLVDPESGFAADLPETTVTHTLPEEAVIPGFEIAAVEVVPLGDPIQAVEVRVTTNNAGAVIGGGTFTLRVMRDGELVEEYALAQNYAIPTGESTLSARYTPLDGWTSGSYSFEVEVATVDASGLETVLATSSAENAVVIP